ncbi:hypothetical protein LZ30DRAFT_707904 [Colletotrichum cereale]|nr:hypothetical protein LZ30DRAFT_707904 [Colletotrichum cereale]
MVIVRTRAASAADYTPDARYSPQYVRDAISHFKHDASHREWARRIPAWLHCQAEFVVWYIFLRSLQTHVALQPYGTQREPREKATVEGTSKQTISLQAF